MAYIDVHIEIAEHLDEVCSKTLIEELRERGDLPDPEEVKRRFAVKKRDDEAATRDHRDDLWQAFLDRDAAHFRILLDRILPDNSPPLVERKPDEEVVASA